MNETCGRGKCTAWMLTTADIRNDEQHDQPHGALSRPPRLEYRTSPRILEHDDVKHQPCTDGPAESRTELHPTKPDAATQHATRSTAARSRSARQPHVHVSRHGKLIASTQRNDWLTRNDTYSLTQLASNGQAAEHKLTHC